MSSDAHPEFGELAAQLRQLAQQILDRLDPAVRAAAMLVGPGDRPGKCQQAWCPVCALAALCNDEEHPLLTIVSENGVALLEVLRAAVADPVRPSSAPQAPSSAAGDVHGHGTPASMGYQHIEVTIEPPQNGET